MGMVAIVAGVAAVVWWWGRTAEKPVVHPRNVVAERTTAARRAEARRRDREEIIAQGLKDPVTAENHAAWSRVFSTMKWTNYRERDGIPPLRAALQQTSWL